MKKNGFTLIELLAVIIILAAISLIALPSVTKSIEESKETAYQTQIDTIKKAANDYILQNLVKGVKYSSFLKNDGDTIDIFLYDLKRAGLVDKDIRNPKTGYLLSDDTIIKIIKNKGNYDVRVGTYKEYGNTKVFEDGLIDDENSSNININTEAPVISLTGSAVRYYEVDASCQESCILTEDVRGFAEVSSDSKNLTYNISGNISEISIKTVKSYNITYNATGENGVSARPLTLVVIVKDTTKPEIKFDSTTTLTTDEAENYDLLTGVTFADNSVSGNSICDTSGECKNGFKLKISGSLTPPIPGNYTVTYELTDPSGNTRIKTRNFVIKED